MTHEAFVAAILGMSMLPDAMREHLVSMAQQLTPEEREETIKELQPLEKEIAETEEEIVATVDEEMEKIEQFKNEELPKLQKQSEDSDKQSAESLFPEQP